MEKIFSRWTGVAVWSIVCYFYVSNAPIKLSIRDLFLMVPQWCEMTDLVGSGCIELTPQSTIAYCATTVILLVLCWYRTEQYEYEVTNNEASSLEHEVKTDEAEEEMKRNIIWESAKCLMDQVDLEYNHCSACIASNNECPGKVGGEAEWASGETNSEDEDDDATREITGAHVSKYMKTKYKQTDLKSFNDGFELKIEKEPHFKKEPNLKSIL